MQAYQSSQVVMFMSCHRVPCPGRRGRATVRPASASASAHGRMDCGLPVKPWHISAPTGPPAW